MTIRSTLEAGVKPRSDPRTTFAAKTYNYLRIGMLAAAAALAYSILEEYYQPGVHTLLGSISGYYYTPVRPVFVSAMVAIGFALIVIKGRTPFEDAFLTLAGIMAPIVAFIPTTDDSKPVNSDVPQPPGVAEMLNIGHYQRGPEHPGDPADVFVAASRNNNLHALLFAGFIAMVLVLIFFLIFGATRSTDSSPRFTPGTWIGMASGFAVVLIGWVLIHDYYWWVEDGHALAAGAMFAFLAVAAGVNCAVGLIPSLTIPSLKNRLYAVAYGLVGLAMIGSGIYFIPRRDDKSFFDGRVVLVIEVIEISLFVVFWIVQTAERWNKGVGPPAAAA